MTGALPLSPPVPRYRTTLAAGGPRVEAARLLRSGGLADDEWDEHCDHVVVHDESTGAVVATCRLLPPERAAALGRGCGDGGFDLSSHAALRPDLVEVGRACLHPGHPTGAVIAQLWVGVADYVQAGGHRYLGMCVSIPLVDGGATAAGVWDMARRRHLAPAALQVVPRVPFDVGTAVRPARLEMPPLLRACLRVGAHVCGPPAHDTAGGTADLYVLLRMVDVSPRLLRRLALHP